MKFYWDTSAVINAALSPEVLARLDHDEHVTCPHMFFEFFSTMTGRGIEVQDVDGNPSRLVFSQADAVLWLKEFASRVSIITLEVSEILDGMAKTRDLGVQGGRIYDFGHAIAALKAGSSVVLTRNERHFAGLIGDAQTVWP